MDVRHPLLGSTSAWKQGQQQNATQHWASMYLLPSSPATPACLSAIPIAYPAGDNDVQDFVKQVGSYHFTFVVGLLLQVFIGLCLRMCMCLCVLSRLRQTRLRQTWLSYAPSVSRHPDNTGSSLQRSSIPCSLFSSCKEINVLQVVRTRMPQHKTQPLSLSDICDTTGTTT
jgi:hypothetical protein